MPSKKNFLLRSLFVAPGLLTVNKPAGSVYSERSYINTYVGVYVYICCYSKCLFASTFSVIVFCAKYLM